MSLLVIYDFPLAGNPTITITSFDPTSTEAILPSGDVFDFVCPGMFKVYVFLDETGGLAVKSKFFNCSIEGVFSNSSFMCGGTSFNKCEKSLVKLISAFLSACFCFCCSISISNSLFSLSSISGADFSCWFLLLSLSSEIFTVGFAFVLGTDSGAGSGAGTGSSSNFDSGFGSGSFSVR